MITSTPWGAVGEFAASRHGAFTRKQAATKDITCKVIARWKRDGFVTEPHPGVLVIAGSPNTWRQRLKVATLASNEAGVAGFLASAALHGADGFGPGPLQLLVPNWRRGFAADVVQHIGPFQLADITDVDGIRTTGIARTLCDIAGVCTPEATRIAFEWAWRSGHSLTWIRQTADRLDHPGRKGPRAILRLLDDAAAISRPTESALEARLELALGDLPGLVRQYEVRDENGLFIARTDFAIPDVKLAIEAHSRRYHFGQSAQDSDELRELAMQSVGWKVMYFGAKRLSGSGSPRADVLTVANRRRQDLRNVDSHPLP